MKQQISVSMMCADILKLPEILKTLEEQQIDYLHLDVMDGDFVPNFQLGSDYIRQIRQASGIPLDIHLMINRPDNKLDCFPIAENDYVSVHYESTPHIHRTLQKIKSYGAKTMLALNPATPICVVENLLEDLDAVLIMTVNPGFAGQQLIPQTLDKVTALRRLLDQRGYADIEVEVDGNVSFANIPKMREAGANIYVAGTSSVFHAEHSIEENVATFHQLLGRE